MHSPPQGLHFVQCAKPSILRPCVLFEDCSAFSRVAACTLALSPICDTLIEGFSHFVTSMTAPIASGWSGLPGGACTHWKAPPLHGAHPKPTLERTGKSNASGHLRK